VKVEDSFLSKFIYMLYAAHKNIMGEGIVKYSTGLLIIFPV